MKPWEVVYHQCQNFVGKESMCISQMRATEEYGWSDLPKY